MAQCCSDLQDRRRWVIVSVWRKSKLVHVCVCVCIVKCVTREDCIRPINFTGHSLSTSAVTVSLEISL